MKQSLSNGRISNEQEYILRSSLCLNTYLKYYLFISTAHSSNDNRHCVISHRTTWDIIPVLISRLAIKKVQRRFIAKKVIPLNPKKLSVQRGLHTFPLQLKALNHPPFRGAGKLSRVGRRLRGERGNVLRCLSSAQRDAEFCGTHSKSAALVQKPSAFFFFLV